jgi:hypothetical protein
MGYMYSEFSVPASKFTSLPQYTLRALSSHLLKDPVMEAFEAKLALMTAPDTQEILGAVTSVLGSNG